ncbi:hypothetical protein [Arthrobacter sp. NPDC089319]|uniref:hypothetical protein n=1 Tax=Arthrobacter sp. NPDC089319 TaxID=3155915 RepID=UPI0034323DD8
MAEPPHAAIRPHPQEDTVRQTRSLSRTAAAAFLHREAEGAGATAPGSSGA